MKTARSGPGLCSRVLGCAVIIALPACSSHSDAPEENGEDIVDGRIIPDALASPVVGTRACIPGMPSCRFGSGVLIDPRQSTKPEIALTAWHNLFLTEEGLIFDSAVRATRVDVFHEGGRARLLGTPKQAYVSRFLHKPGMRIRRAYDVALLFLDKTISKPQTTFFELDCDTKFGGGSLPSNVPDALRCESANLHSFAGGSASSLFGLQLW